MARETPLLARAKLSKQLGQRHWQAEFENGAECIAHLNPNQESLQAFLAKEPYPEVILELTAFDLKRGRIIALA